MTKNKEQGFGLLEILVSMSLLAVVGLSLASSMYTAIRTQKKTLYADVAYNLAVNKVELYAAINTADLDDTYDDNETGLTLSTLPDITFDRVTDVTVNADNSRTVDITVTCNHPLLPVSIDYSATYPVWE